MERSRSKRSYYYDQDYESENMGRTRPRYNNNNNNNNYHNYSPTAGAHRHRGGGDGGGGRGRGRGGGGGGHRQDQSLSVTTNYRILCHDAKAGGVIGKSGSIIKYIRQHTGAWINVHELMPGDIERIIEISDTRRRDPDGRMPSFSPAQEALLLIHERIIESDGGFGNNGGGYTVEDHAGRLVTRLVVSRAHVGSLLGKGGKIIEQMRMETKTQIRVLPRDHNLPRCVSMADEVVQVVGEVHDVKNALSVIASRLRESQHRDRTNFQGRAHSPERFFPPDDDFIPHSNNTARRTMDGNSFGSRRGNNYGHRPSGFSVEADSAPMAEHSMHFDGEELVFRILCPTGKINRLVSESDGIIDLLQNEIGVDVKISGPVAGSEEQVVVISSDEGPDDDLFPAQEALLHIQTHIVDLFPDKENIVNTRLLVPSREIGCLEGKEGSLSEIRKLTGANVQILPREELPSCVVGADEIVQIFGEIKAARNALVEITSRLRSHLFRDFYDKDSPPPVSSQNAIRRTSTPDSVPSDNISHAREVPSRTSDSQATHQSVQKGAASKLPKEKVVSNIETSRDDSSGGMSRIAVPLVTRSTIEVVIPEHAVPKLITKSRNKLSQISELSGANVSLLEDRPDTIQKIIQISGTPEQVERAQSLLQGFILSTQEDAL